MPTYGNSEQFKLDFLFKKSLGVPTGVGATATPAGESAGISKPKILKNLVINQDIPAISPEGSGITLSNTIVGSPYAVTGQTDYKYTNTTYPWIVKYTLTLKSQLSRYSYYYNSPADNLNLLDSAIPFNYDLLNNSYKYRVTFGNGMSIPAEGINGSYPWILDTDVGYLYFINSDFPTTDAPIITFWRYEGTYGVGSSSGSSSGDLSSNGNLFITGDVSLNGNVTIGKDLTINGRLNVQNYTNQNIINTTTTNYQLIVSEDVSLNGNLTSTGNLNAVSNGNVDSINFWTLTKYMNSLINAPPAVTFGTVDTLSTMIRIPWTYPTQYNIGIADTLIPVIKTLTITYSITKSGGAIQNGTIINALNTNSYIKSSLTDTYPITGIVLLKTGVTSGYTTNYTFTDGNRNAYVFTDSNIQGLTTNDTLTLNVYYTNNNTSTNTASKPSLNFAAAGTPSAPVYRSSTPSTTSVTITIGNPQYGDAINNTTPTEITTYRVNYSSTSNATRYGGLISSGLKTVATTVSVTPTGNPNVYANTTPSITANIYPETTYTANITAVNNVNSNVGTYSGNFTFTTNAYVPPSTAWSNGGTLSFTGLSYASNMAFSGNGQTVSTLIMNVPAATTYTSNNITTIINDFERRGIYGAGNTTTISANIVVNGTVTNGPSVSLDANVGYTTVPTASNIANIMITPISIADNYAGNIIGYDGYYKQYTGNIKLISGFFTTPSPNLYTVNLNRTSGNVSANVVTSFPYYYDTITGNPTAPVISTFAINTTSYTQVCGINLINAATFTATYSVTNLGQYFFKTPLIAYSSPGTIGTIINATETNLPAGNVYIGNSLIYSTVNFNARPINSSSLGSVFSTSIPLTVTAYNNNGGTSTTFATPISAIIDGPSVSLLNTISTLGSIDGAGSGAVPGARFYAGATPDTITSNSNSITLGSLFTNVTGAYNHATSLLTYTKELQIANGYFVTKASSYGYKDYTLLKYNSTTANGINYSTVTSSGVYRYACFAWNIPLSQYTGLTTLTFTMVGATGFSRAGGSTFQPLTANSASLGTTVTIPFYYKIEDTGGTTVTYWVKGNEVPAGGELNNNSISTVGQASTPYQGITNIGAAFATDTNNFKTFLPNVQSGKYTSNTRIYCIIGLPMDANCYFQYMTLQVS